MLAIAQPLHGAGCNGKETPLSLPKFAVPLPSRLCARMPLLPLCLVIVISFFYVLVAPFLASCTNHPPLPPLEGMFGRNPFSDLCPDLGVKRPACGRLDYASALPRSTCYKASFSTSFFIRWEHDFFKNVV